MNVVSGFSGIGPVGSFTPGSSTPAPFNVPHTGLTDGAGPSSASINVAELYNRILLQIDAAIAGAGLTVDHTNWAQLGQAMAAYVGGGAAVTTSWSYYNAASQSASGTVNYQTASSTQVGVTGTGTVMTTTVSGKYFVSGSATIGYTGGASGMKGELRIYKNGADTGITNFYNESNNTWEMATVSVSGLLDITAGDTLSIHFGVISGPATVQAGTGSFIGHLL